jgi:hypothetical protein
MKMLKTIILHIFLVEDMSNFVSTCSLFVVTIHRMIYTIELSKSKHLHSMEESIQISVAVY